MRSDPSACIFDEGNQFGRRLNWCYASRVRKPMTIRERRQLVYETNGYLGRHLAALVRKYA